MSTLHYLLGWQLQRHISSLPGKLLCFSNVLKRRRHWRASISRTSVKYLRNKNTLAFGLEIYILASRQRVMMACQAAGNEESDQSLTHQSADL